MSKIKSTFFCKNCGFETLKWEGKCPVCSEWNTIIEFKSPKLKRNSPKNVAQQSKPSRLEDVAKEMNVRISTQNSELDEVLGGGIVPGSLLLLSGEPGVGKSTLTLQTALQMNAEVLYVSGEESKEQIKLRADRLPGDQSQVSLLPETDLDTIMQVIQDEQPELVIVDSIQTLSWSQLDNNRGSVSQIKECTFELQRIAKEQNVPIILIGHINKDGNIAGPKLVEHIVDVVLYFEGDKKDYFRILKSSKNRFGSTDELGLFTMTQQGLEIVVNPSELLVTTEENKSSGCAIAATLEGKRALLIEVQALVSPSVYSTPQRSTTGFDIRRLHMLLAVIEKRLGLLFNQHDVFLNIVGGMKIDDPAIDLAVIASLISSHQDISIPDGFCFAGEVGLTGEVRPVSRLDIRNKESKKMGYDKLVVSKNQREDIAQSNTLSRVSELIPLLFA